MQEPGLWHAHDAPLVKGTGWTGCGSAFDVYEAALRARYGESLARVVNGAYPHARDIADLGAASVRAGGAFAPDQAAPLYVRDKVAMTIDERGLRKAAPSSDR